MFKKFAENFEKNVANLEKILKTTKNYPEKFENNFESIRRD